MANNLASNATLTIGNLGLNTETVNARTLTISGSGNTLITGTISDGNASKANSLIIDNTGITTISGTSTYGGTTQVNAGTLVFRSTAAKGAGTVTAAAAGSIGLGVGGAGYYSSANVASLFNSSLSGFSMNAASGVAVDTTAGDFTVSDALSGSRSFTKLGAGMLRLSATNTFTGPMTISSGTVEVSGAGQLAGTTGTYAGNLSVAAASVFSHTSSASSTLSGTISGAGGLVQSGAGTLTLRGANTYGGSTRVTGGVLALGVSDVLSGSTAVTVAGGVLSMGSNSNSVGSFTITSGSVTGSGKLTAGSYGLGGGTVSANLGSGTLNVTGGASSLNGTSDATALNLNAGVLTLGSASRLTQASVAVTGSSGASLTLGGNESFGSLAGAANIALGGHTLSVGGNGVFSGALSGSGGLTKIGSGKFTLSGANTYTGSTIISGGTLALGAGGALAGSKTIVAGNAGSSGAMLDLSALAGVGNTFTFAADQKVMGKGTIDLGGGTLRVLGTLAPGNSPGNLTINGNLAWQSVDAGYQWEINDTTGTAGMNWDLLTVTGALDLTSLSATSKYLLDLTTLTSLNAAGPMANYLDGDNYTWSLVSASSVLLASGTAAAGTDITSLFNVSLANWANTKPSAGNYSIRVASSGQGIDLVIVPEPATIVFASIGIAMAGWSLWKHRRIAC